MFDTVWGIPVHILVIHLVVVVGPISAVLGIAYAVRPRWRARLRRPLMVGAVITGITGLIAGESGEQLQRRVLVAPDLIDLAQLQKHVEAGDIAKVLCLIFMVVTVVVIVAVGPNAHLGGSRPMLNRVASLLLVVVSVATLVSLVLTGHRGVEATWTNIVRDSSSKVALLDG